MRQRNKGQSMVEFALILPLLLLIFLGIIDGAFILQGYLTVNHAAREAARFAITYQPNQGECLDGVTTAPYPYCPATLGSESDTAYQQRRVQLIKLAAVDAAVGLRYNTPACMDWTCINSNINVEGMLGVRVWGYPSFEEAMREDNPGLPGLPVRVQVIHNVPLVVFAPVLPNSFVRVNGVTDMINEGIQVGYGDRPPPTSPPIGTLPWETPQNPPPGSEPTATTGPSPTPTQIPEYRLTLDFETASNQLPTEREHRFGALVSDEAGQPVAGARVTFRTDEGSFSYAGSGVPLTAEYTGADGWARLAIYANLPTTATIEAWLDYDGDLVIDTNEPSDTAVKTWWVTGPYLVVTNHNPAPLEVIGVNVMDHLPTNNPYSLWWCPVSTTQSINRRMVYPINVDTVTWDALDLQVQVPLTATGDYRLESHRGTGGSNGCTENSTLVAASATIRLAATPPDLHISSVTFVSGTTVLPGRPITLVIGVENLNASWVTGGPFDLDLYLDRIDPPSPRELGKVKVWIPTLGPLASTTITSVVTVYKFGAHNLWAQVDTTNYIDEGSTGETNNVYGPVNFNATDCVLDLARSDTFNGGLGSQWTQAAINTNVSGAAATTGNQLSLTGRGLVWGGSNRGYYLYQTLTGNFDARLRLIQKPQPNVNNNNVGRFGLHVRASTDPTAPYAMIDLTSRSTTRLEVVYRDSASATPTRPYEQSSATPLWVRIVRQGNNYTYLSASTTEPRPSDWITRGTSTMVSTMNQLGIIISSGSDSTSYGPATGIADDFRLCSATVTQEPTEPQDTIHPPGLIQCSELIRIPGFEGNSETVFTYWSAGSEGAFAQSSAQIYRGSFALRLHASLGAWPCSENILQPYLYQLVTIPTEVYSITTLVVTGHYRAEGSSFRDCSNADRPEADDVLYLRLQQTGGTDITSPQLLMTGALSHTWQTISTTLSSQFNLVDYAGQTVRLYWNGTHDQDYNGTFFYLDEMSAQVCTNWPIPAPISGTASFGGLVSTIGENNVPIIITGADVWAYAQGGQIYHTKSIHDGTYHFYNIPPGTYLVYAEATVGADLRTATVPQITLAADERRYDIRLLLQ